MRDKNEDIHLWLLEQNRKKDRVRLLEESNQEMPSVPVSILNHPWFNNEEAYKVEVERPTFSENADLDALLKEKADLEEEMHRTDEEIKELDSRVKALREKIIEETKKRNIEKRLEIERWRKKIEALENQLGLTSPSD